MKLTLLTSLPLLVCCCVVVVSSAAIPSTPIGLVEETFQYGVSSCPAGVVNTACADNATCCPVLYSNTGYGCCTLPNATCCGQQACCPQGYTCQNTPPYESVCVKGNDTIASTQVCGAGPLYTPGQNSLPSLVAIGDSVSIGYTPVVASLLNTTIDVVHSPNAGGGGTDDVQNGLNCETAFVYNGSYVPVPWNIVSFNFGLHDLNNESAAELLYAERLTNFTDNLIAMTSSYKTKLIYITTTPQMQFRTQGNMVVEDLNRIAIGIMQARNIPVADLYSHVTAYCGDVYDWCSICDDEYNPATGVYCGYHYTAQGWQYLGEFLAPIYQSLLTSG